MPKTRRTVLITGAGQNIGRATAIRLAQDGFNVVINGKTNKASCEEVAGRVHEAGGKAHIAMGDIGTPADVKRIVSEAIGAFGGVDVLVNNAAIRPETPFLEMAEDEWHSVMNVNFNSCFWLARAALPGMIEEGWGRVILFAGMNAIHGYNGRSHVSASKHAAWGLAKSLGKEFGPKGITTNIISPGPIRPEAGDPSMVSHIKSQVGRIPAGRLGEATEIAAMVSHLASDEGGFINGQMLQINGGTET